MFSVLLSLEENCLISFSKETPVARVLFPMGTNSKQHAREKPRRVIMEQIF